MPAIAPPRGDGGIRAINVSPLNADLLDATVRLMRLTDRPRDYRALAPLVIREIVYRLVTGAQGGRRRHLSKLGGQAHRMARTVDWLRKTSTSHCVSSRWRRSWA